MWEIHEVFRKLTLMGVLVFFPPFTRAATAILVCVVSCCSLNFFRPHRNHIVLAVAQTAFLLSTFKYVVAVLLTSDDLKGEDLKRETFALGCLMIAMDVVFMMGSVTSMLALLWLLWSKIAATAKKEETDDTGTKSSGSSNGSESGTGNSGEGSSGSSGSSRSTKIMPHDIKVWKAP